MEIIALILPTAANTANDFSRRGRDGGESRHSTDIFSLSFCPSLSYSSVYVMYPAWLVYLFTL